MNMANLCTIIEFTQNLCLENSEINNVLKKIDEINRENCKLINQLEEANREHVRLQITLFNMEIVISHNDISDMHNLQETWMKTYKNCVELRKLIEKIDFVKILQCYHIEMETDCRTQWHPMQEALVETLKWHDKMEQRYIVKKYRQSEIEFRKVNEGLKNHQESLKGSLKQTFELIYQTKEKRNELIIVLIKQGRNFNELQEKMNKLNEYQTQIEDLRQEKIKLKKQLEKNCFKTFNPVLTANNNRILSSTFKPSIETCNFITPQLPSFADILKSFNQPEQITNVTAIENTTKFCIKSILQTSSCNQLVTTKQTKNVRFKVKLEEYQEDMTQKIYNSEIESETDVQIDILPTKTTMKVNKEYLEKNENLQEMKDLENSSDVEVVDLLTPSNDSDEAVKPNPEFIDSFDCSKNQIVKKPAVEIQECIIFKTPFPIQKVLDIKENENTLNSVAANSSKQSTKANSSNLSTSDVNDMSIATKKSFYEEFLNASSSTEVSPTAERRYNSNETAGLNVFENFLNDNSDFLFDSKKSIEQIAANQTKLNNPEKNTAVTDTQDFLDFDFNKQNKYDSDDFMSNYNATNMDFM